MSRALLKHSMFYDVLFPPISYQQEQSREQLALRKSIRYRPNPTQNIYEANLVIFDLETTGLDADGDEIIEIGAQKYCQGKLQGEMSSLIHTNLLLPETVTKLTGITQQMLEGQPSLQVVLPKFLQFIDGCILAAHNAAFDTSFILRACLKMGIELDWPIFCTLKMARDLLPDLERKNLDSLADHYQLKFEARHRSIGDVKVTAAVMWEMLDNEGSDIQTWHDLQPYYIPIN